VRTLAGSDLKIPPRSNEIEVSVFGPGIGESIVVHLNGGQWMIVDSCLSRATKKPAALDYLAKIGVKVSANVRFVVSTHWHDDHIRGLAKVYEKCESAELVSAHGLNSDQFTQLLSCIRVSSRRMAPVCKSSTRS
jgi:glyoxylase-like metal-dependent hydrolase (beta-lactamase superfamily II)